ncbi:hypothetical protein DM860_015678 [Cuscuta australis]|uniref:CASP-like protein n=1 Tax=Cuscuta australis TaxID=267555 RepID=A0A328DI60_9ASTE|nr:hypothetical protein DM860_015678 [Cuscuta australis]
MEVVGGKEKGAAVAAKRQGIRWADFSLRLLAFANTLAAALVLGLDKQSKEVSMQVFPTLPPVSIPVTAKWKYMSAFVYFVVVNGIACGYAAVSLAIIWVDNNRGQNSGRTTTSSADLMLLLFDLIMVVALFSGVGATTAVGLLGFYGNSHLRWNKVCNVFGIFCAKVGGAITVSLLGATLFLLLVVLATLKLHNNNKHP